MVMGRLQQRSWTAEDGSARSVVAILQRSSSDLPAIFQYRVVGCPCIDVKSELGTTACREASYDIPR
jgi:hypothetical protein